jgi:hypothetical protein
LARCELPNSYARFIHPLSLLITRFADKQLAKLVEYLLAENRILQSKLPQRIEVAPAERAKLVKLGKPLGSKLKDIISNCFLSNFSPLGKRDRTYSQATQTVGVRVIWKKSAR